MNKIPSVKMKTEKPFLFSGNRPFFLLAFSLLFLLASAFSIASFSPNVYASDNSSKISLDQFKVYNEPEQIKHIITLPSNNTLNSKSYHITLTGNERNYNIDHEILSDGKVLISLISPEINEKYETESVASGQLIKEKTSEFEKRKDDLEKIYEEVNISKKEFLVYNNMPVKNKKGQTIDTINKKTIGQNVVYNYVIDPKKDQYVKLGENSATIELLEDLVAYYKLDETSGTTAEDSHSSNDGTTKNSPTLGVTGKINKSFDFTLNSIDQTKSQYIDNVAPIPYSDFTINAWINKDVSLEGGIIYSRGSAGDPFVYFLTSPTGKLSVWARSNAGSGLIQYNAGTTLNSNTWYMVTLTFDVSENNFTLFLNNVQDGSVSYTGGTWSNAVEYELGAGYNVGGAGSQGFNGIIDEVGIWAKALTNDEIEALYNSGDGLSYDNFDVSAPTTTTSSASSIGSTYATLNGQLTDLGEETSVEAYFQYRETGSGTWLDTSASSDTLTATGSFNYALTGLDAETEYEFRSVIEYGTSEFVYGSTLTFETLASDPPEITTLSAISISSTGATLRGSLTTLGDYTPVDVFFQYRIKEASVGGLSV